MHLDRDDRGNYRDTILVDGESINNPLNQETVTVRGIVAGEYVVNIFHYLATTPDIVPVTVKIEKLNPKVTVLFYGTIDLDHTGQEETAARFVIDRDGTVIDVNTREKSLVQLSRKAPTMPSRSDATSSDDLPQRVVPTPRGIVLDQ